MPGPNIIEVLGLSRRYGSDPPVSALVDVTFNVSAGDWVAVVGPSGSGKSTLLNILGGIDSQTDGTYRFDGIDVAALADDQRAGLRGERIGFVFQAFHLLPHRTVLENVMLAEIYRGTPKIGRRERAEALLERVGMSHRTQFLPTRLSGGESQRVAVARSLMGSPRLLLCDEPTGNLDSGNTAAILDLFEKLNREGVTIVMITHEADVAARARRVLHITDGVLNEAA